MVIISGAEDAVTEAWDAAKDLIQYIASPLYTSSIPRVHSFKSNSFTSPTKSRYPVNTIGCIVLYCNRLIILYTQIVHKKYEKHF